MDWKQTLPSFIVGAILGIAGLFFAFQGRISKLEAQLAQFKTPVLSENESANENIDWHTPWEGKWQHTEMIIHGSFSGNMELEISGDDISKLSVAGASDNSQGGKSTLEGQLTDDGRTLIGKWKNLITGQQGIFKFSLITPTYFEGNYAVEGGIVRAHVNKWVGIKIE